MYLPLDRAELVLQMLVEGNSVSTVERITGVHHGTILKLLVLAGEKCERIMAEKVRNVAVRDVECDELWAFIGKKQKRLRAEDDQNLGDCYTFVAIERHSKLVLNIAMGKRDGLTTNAFIEGVRDAIAPGRFQITSDGFAPYKTAIPDTFGNRVDFAMLIKVYRSAPEGERRYSPAEVESVEVVPVCGNPDPDRICTSIIERSNLSLRMTQSVNTANNQINGYSYDANGNQTGVPVPGAGTVTAAYDIENRMVQLGTAGKYAYNAQNQRVWRQGTESGTTSEYFYFYGVGGQRIASYKITNYPPVQAFGNVAAFSVQATDVLVYYGSKLLQEGAYTTTFSPNYVGVDRLGSMPGGKSLYPWGEEVTATANDRIKFATYLRDGESGIDYAMNRYYSSPAGRFLTPDKSLSSRATADPGQWSKYAYVGGDPINYTDRRGLFADSAEDGDDGDDGNDDDDCLLDPSKRLYDPTGCYGWSRTPSDPPHKPTKDQHMPIRVRDYSNSGQNQDAIAAVLKKIEDALASDKDCAGWLQSPGGAITGETEIKLLLDYNAFGYGHFNQNYVAAVAGSSNVDGTPSGIPITSAITVNSDGAFFKSGFKVGARGYAGNTLKADAAILIHELGHALAVTDFLPDYNDVAAGKKNDAMVDKHCGKLIERLK